MEELKVGMKKKVKVREETKETFEKVQAQFYLLPAGWRPCS